MDDLVTRTFGGRKRKLLPPTMILIHPLNLLVPPYSLLHLEREHIDLVCKSGRKIQHAELGDFSSSLDVPAHSKDTFFPVLHYGVSWDQCCSCRADISFSSWLDGNSWMKYYMSYVSTFSSLLFNSKKLIFSFLPV